MIFYGMSFWGIPSDLQKNKQQVLFRKKSIAGMSPRKVSMK
jgi:hypothetical protein